MKLSTYLFSLILSQIIFNLTLIKGEYILDPNSDDYPYLVYGHFIPFMREGVNSLSMHFDWVRFIIEQNVFYIITLIFIHRYKIKLNNITLILLSTTFIISSIFIYITLIPDTSFRTINDFFNYRTITSYWT